MVVTGRPGAGGRRRRSSGPVSGAERGGKWVWGGGGPAGPRYGPGPGIRGEGAAPGWARGPSLLPRVRVAPHPPRTAPAGEGGPDLPLPRPRSRSRSGLAPPRPQGTKAKVRARRASAHPLGDTPKPRFLGRLPPRVQSPGPRAGVHGAGDLLAGCVLPHPRDSLDPGPSTPPTLPILFPAPLPMLGFPPLLSWNLLGGSPGCASEV